MKSLQSIESLCFSNPEGSRNDYFTCENTRRIISDNLKGLENRYILNNRFIHINILSAIQDVQFEENFLHIEKIIKEYRAIWFHQNVVISLITSESVSIPLKSIESIRKENGFIVLAVHSGMPPITIITRKEGYKQDKEKKDIRERCKRISSVYTIHYSGNDTESEI